MTTFNHVSPTHKVSFVQTVSTSPGSSVRLTAGFYIALAGRKLSLTTGVPTPPNLVEFKSALKMNFQHRAAKEVLPNMNSKSTTFPRDTKYGTLVPGLLLTTISGKMPALTQCDLLRLQATRGGRLKDDSHL